MSKKKSTENSDNNAAPAAPALPKVVQKMAAELAPFLNEPGIIGEKAKAAQRTIGEIAALMKEVRPRAKSVKTTLKALRNLSA